MRDTSATYSVNFLKLVPICTFFTSIILKYLEFIPVYMYKSAKSSLALLHNQNQLMNQCRSEKLRLHTWAGKAKCGGAILCIGGALATGIYKGKEFYLGHHSHHVQTVVTAHETHMLQGTFFFYLQLLLIQSLVYCSSMYLIISLVYCFITCLNYCWFFV